MTKRIRRNYEACRRGILTEFLQGHAPKGVSRKYVSTMILAKSEAPHEAQARISARIMELLQLTAADLRAL
jgi:hypothetical protein